MGTIEPAAWIGAKAGIPNRPTSDEQHRDDHRQNSGSGLMVTERYRKRVAGLEPGIFSIFPDKYRFGCKKDEINQSVASQFPSRRKRGISPT
jgi:hypothetical protein